MVISIWQADEQSEQQHQRQEAERQIDENKPKEFLLVFQKLGIFVDSQGFLKSFFFLLNLTFFIKGRRSRAQEMMFPCRLNTQAGFAFRRPYLLHFSDYQISVFNIHNAEWVQTVNLRAARSLDRSGLFLVCQVLDSPHLILLGAHQPS